MTFLRIPLNEEQEIKRVAQNRAYIEAERLDAEAEEKRVAKRNNTHPPRHDKLRGPYGKRK